MQPAPFGRDAAVDVLTNDAMKLVTTEALNI
jgi:hypothetical protein